MLKRVTVNDKGQQRVVWADERLLVSSEAEATEPATPAVTLYEATHHKENTTMGTKPITESGLNTLFHALAGSTAPVRAPRTKEMVKEGTADDKTSLLLEAFTDRRPPVRASAEIKKNNIILTEAAAKWKKKETDALRHDPISALFHAFTR